MKLRTCTLRNASDAGAWLCECVPRWYWPRVSMTVA